MRKEKECVRKQLRIWREELVQEMFPDSEMMEEELLPDGSRTRHDTSATRRDKDCCENREREP
jgi:hypothetical protein